ncbi:MAG: hypothetical protein AB7F88_03545 [Pyrinomonadaceae bacterium]
MSEFSPPEGFCFYTADWIAADQMSRTLCKIVSFIQEIDPYASLRCFDDWWEHDGLHFRKGSIGIGDLFDLVHSPKSLLESTPADDLVFVGIGSGDGKWYLRYRVEWDDSETNIVGRFAFMLADHLAERFKTAMQPKLEQALDEVRSDEFYRETIK